MYFSTVFLGVWVLEGNYGITTKEISDREVNVWVPGCHSIPNLGTFPLLLVNKNKIDPDVGGIWMIQHDINLFLFATA